MRDPPRPGSGLPAGGPPSSEPESPSPAPGPSARAESSSRNPEKDLLRLLGSVVVHSNRREDPEGALRGALEEICRCMGWPVGHLHLALPRNFDRQIAADLWHLDPTVWHRDHTVSPLGHPDRLRRLRERKGGRGSGIADRVLAEGQALWVKDLEEEGKELARLASGCGVPLLVGREVVGALELLTPERTPRDERLMEVLEWAGVILGRVVERDRAGKELGRLSSAMEDQTESRDEGPASASTELTAAVCELEAFAYSVSHDLRAPLRALDGFSQAVLEDYGDELDETGRDYLRRIRAASQRMGTLMDDLLKLSRISREEVERVPVDLGALAREVEEDLRTAEPEREIEVVVQPDLRTRGDTNLLRIVVQNLLENAWKFTRKEPDPRIEVGREEVDGREAFFVRDNGVGFDPDFSEKLFSPFQRLHPASEFEGNGIGLATVHRILHRHGGWIRGRGVVGEGATFHFTLEGGARE